ncbi:MAG: fasciclin domain-containing protein, partial [Candidatus Thermoplasmatota archaeon]|nr:fasciclin domain-containing protein [Candidatus Thermoplasmatota archaeon]
CLSADTVNTNPLSFTVDNSGVMVNNATVVTPDVQTSNGVIHVIDKVLLPTATTNDIPRTAQCTGSHATLVGAVIQAELLATLQGEGPFTVFAPTDQAFIDAGIDLVALNTDEGKAQLTDILLHHVYISEAVQSSQITDGAMLSMANGDNITITVTDGSVMIGDATVTLADVATSNGVIHVVDKVIMPPSDVVDDSTGDSSSDSEDGIFGLSDGQATIVGAIGLVAILALIGGIVFFVRGKGSAATLAKDFASGGLMNQLQTVDESAYAGSAQVSAQAAVQAQPVETVEVIQQQPVVAEPNLLRQWTDEAGYTWRAMDDGTTYWWTGSDWQKYG